MYSALVPSSSQYIPRVLEKDEQEKSGRRSHLKTRINGTCAYQHFRFFYGREFVASFTDTLFAYSRFGARLQSEALKISNAVSCTLRFLHAFVLSLSKHSNAYLQLHDPEVASNEAATSPPHPEHTRTPVRYHSRGHKRKEF